MRFLPVGAQISGVFIGVISKDKVLEIGKELNRRLLIPFQQKGVKRDHPLTVGKEFIEGIFDDIPFKPSADDICE